MKTAAGQEVKVGDEVMVVQRFIVEEVKSDKDGTVLMGFKNLSKSGGFNHMQVKASLEDVEEVYVKTQASPL